MMESLCDLLNCNNFMEDAPPISLSHFESKQGRQENLLDDNLMP
jgi:hypothetical protein